MAAAFVRALVTVLLMGRVAVLYRYCAVLVTLFCTRGRLPASPAALCTRGRWPARSPSAPRAFGSARRLEARPGPAAALGHRSLSHVEGVPCRRPRAPQLPACRRGALPPPSGTAASRMSKGCSAAALEYRSRPHAEGAPCRRPRAPQPPACRRGALPPAPASFPPLRPCWQSAWLCTYKIAGTKRSRRFTVGVAGFEPTASSSRTKRATKLRHTPVPNEYSHTSSENPNRDRRTMGSVCHAAKMSVR